MFAPTTKGTKSESGMRGTSSEPTNTLIKEKIMWNESRTALTKVKKIKR